MALDPATTKVIQTGATLVVKPTLGFLRAQYHRRGAEFADIATLSGAEPELDEAIAVLRGTADSLPATLLTKLKGFLSARPESFADADARAFVNDDRVVALVKSGARRTLRNEDIAEERRRARVIHSELHGEEGIYGETLIEDAVAFATMTLLGHLTPGERQTIELLDQLRDEMHGRFDQISTQIEGLRHAPDLTNVEAAPFNSIIQAEVRRLRRQRMLQIPDFPERALALGARIETGLYLADPAALAVAFREIAVVLLRAERLPEAEPWIVKAEALGADVTCERARIAIAEMDFDGALRMLRDRLDPESRGLLLHAIARRDGEESALAYYDNHFGPHDLTGHSMQAVSARLLNAGRHEDSAALLDQATPPQIDENPVLLWARARHKISQAMAPDMATRVLEHEGLVPRRTDLHDDADGRRRLLEARVDLQQLEPGLGDLGSKGFADLVDVNLLFLGLCTGEPAEREMARSRFIARINDPAQTAQLAPLATLYGIQVDWTGLKAGLAAAEALGGYDDEQVRAAFALVMDEGEPGAIADFVHRYRDRLEAYSANGSVVAVEIEATAKAGRMDDAKALLDAERETLGEEAYAFLEATLAELDGGDAVGMRLAQFEASQSTHDLKILVDAMREKRDPRLGEYLISLWRLRRQVGDAQYACDVLVGTGEELRAEEFLEELGEEARADPMLRTHLAWARFRQGRLDEAQAELHALSAGGTDDPNTRHLRVMLAIETGRWAELEPFVQEQLAAAADRSAAELIGATRIARTIGSTVTFDLLRAAVEKAPDDPAINLQAYTIATEAGLERSAEVNGWFSTALATGEEKGLIQTKKFDEVVEFVKESRAEADRISGLINAADVPMFMAISAMGGTQSALVIRQTRSNAEQTDSRRRSVVPLFAGNRVLRGDLRPTSISFDPLALLVLDYLGLLEASLGAFKDVVLPSGTLHSFFEDRGKAAHSQPSRVAQARQVKDSVASGVLTVESFPQVANGDAPVDDEFAALFAAAEARNGYVIDNAPLHPPGSLDEIVDPTPYAERLLSPKGLVASLLSAGLISRAAVAVAEPLVAGSGDPWADEPIPAPGRPLFLTSLAVHFLVDAGLLPILKSHAGTLFVSKETVRLADNEIAAGEAAEEIRDGIERIRAVLARAIANKSARIGPARRLKDDLERADHRTAMSPMMSVLRDTAGIDAFVCDDRAMNKYPRATDRAGNAFEFVTTAELLVILSGMGALDEDALDAAREKLRRGGGGLMPLDPEEVARAVCASNWSVGPNAELRAIRDSIHLPLARRVAQLPNERPWFKSVSIGVAYGIRAAWGTVVDDEDAERAANYLFDMIADPAAWSEGDESPDRQAWILDVSRHTLWVMASMFDIPPSRIERYRHWFATRVEPAYAKRDPGALEAVARTLFAFLASPMDEKADDDA